MKLFLSHRLFSLSIAAALAFSPLAAFAQGGPMMGGMKRQDSMGGGMMGGGQDHMMGGGMTHDEMTGGGTKHEGMMGGGMMGGGMMGGEMGQMPHVMRMMDHMAHMMSMIHERAVHAADRIASLKSELKITEAQTPAWNKFADALLAAAKSTEQSVQGMEKQIMEAHAPASLPETLERHAKMAASNAANLNAIKAALDPLYASFSDEQKKIADGLKVGPMGLM